MKIANINIKCQNCKDFMDRLLKEQIESLKEQLANAIIPKFKIGQKVWFIYGKSIRSFTILKIDIEIRNCVLITYSDRGWCQFEENCFATKAEAEAKLKEMMKSE